MDGLYNINLYIFFPLEAKHFGFIRLKLNKVELLNTEECSV